MKKKEPMKVTWREPRPDDPMFGKTFVVTIRHDDPCSDTSIVSDAFTDGLPEPPNREDP